MDHDRLFVGFIVEDHDLQEAARAVRSDDEIPTVTRDYSYGMANGVQHVSVADTVPSGAVRDLNLDKVPLSARPVKLALSEAVSISVRRLRRARLWRAAALATAGSFARRSRFGTRRGAPPSLPLRDRVLHRSHEPRVLFVLERQRNHRG